MAHTGVQVLLYRLRKIDRRARSLGTGYCLALLVASAELMASRNDGLGILVDVKQQKKPIRPMNERPTIGEPEPSEGGAQGGRPAPACR
jgi:hypothetical protein